ncbi:3-Oxoacyl-(acyl-carrier-protein (ACP)) synthase III [Actinobacteria bacterium OK074]|nr:3-Oxoacyl-(acyl-carrier-protein (ACP)) synthase III [Actinobacteria bacterium OK074]
MTDTDAYLVGCSYELGARSLPVASLFEGTASAGTADAGPAPGTGFAYYREATGDLFDLWRPAMERALKASGTAPEDVDTVLFSTESLPRGESAHRAVAELMDGLGMRNAYPVTTGFADCSTATAAVGMAAALVRSGGSRTAMVVSGDLVRTVLPEGRVILGGSAIASDGAAAAVVSREPLGRQILGTARHMAWDLVGPGAEHRGQLRAQLAAYRRLFEDLWERTGCTARDVAAVLPSNLAAGTTRIFLGDVGFSAGQIFQDNVSRIAHCLGSDPLINLVDHRAAASAPAAGADGPAPGSPVVLLGASAAHLAAVLLRDTEDH